MGKLSNLKPSLRNLSPRIGYAEGDAKAGDKARNNLAPWRAWYRTARWQHLRMQVFTRDAFKCQRTGILCVGKYPAPNSAVANHKRPHRGDPALFWDINNIETVSKEVHDGLIQAEERAQY
jgi:5-methylcytosine-specific restriction protein A